MNTIYFLVKSRAAHRDDIGLEPPDQKADSLKHAENIIEQRKMLEDLVPMRSIDLLVCGYTPRIWNWSEGKWVLA